MTVERHAGAASNSTADSPRKRKADRSLMAACAASVALAGTTTAAAQIETLGQPCRAKQVLAGRVVTERRDGHEWFVLTNDNETHGAELLFIDFQKDTGQMFPAPAGAGSWALNEVQGDRLVVGTFYDGMFMVFDLKQRKFVKTISFPGESYIWNLAVGSDGRVYGGTYPGGKLGALNLDTYTVEDCGAPAPPNQYLRNVSATPEGLILCSFGMQKPDNLLYDPATKQFSPLPKQLEGASLGVTWNGFFLVGAQVYRGREFQIVDPPPFPVPPADKGSWYVDTYLTTPETLFLHQGNAVYRYARGDAALTLLADIDLRGGRLLAGDRQGDLLGVRGQDYFVIKPGDKTLRLRPIPVEGRGRPTLFLKADDQGRLWGGPHFGQTLFYCNLRSRKVVNTGVICDAGGEVYDVTFLDGKVYAASYAGGDITCYDPRARWNQWDHQNPKPLATVGPDYIRPTGGILTGADGKLYSGWMAKYGTYGGAVAITDPTSGKTERIENPLGEQAISGLAVDGHLAYIGTSLEANGLPGKTGESPGFGVLDLTTRKVLFTQRFEGAGGVRSVVFDAATKRVAMVVGDRLHVFDAARSEFVTDLPADLPRVTSSSLVAPGNGTLLYGNEKTVLALDLRDSKITPVGTLPAKVTNIAADRKGAVYVSCDADLYRLRVRRPRMRAAQAGQAQHAEEAK
jgi:outer membrane protein assembly factor BamB